MKKKVFSGIQPSGNLHIGNYFGALKQWIGIQEQYDCVYGIVDLHAMTVRYEPQELPERTLDAAISYLSAGLDHEKSVLMVQSLVPQHTELAWILNCVTPLSWCERVPTFKDKVAQNADNINVGLLDYPVLMSADILIYKSEFVPVGKDQIPHLELCREIARKFNSTFGGTFPEPQPIMGEGAVILGLDGKFKMSKSLGNCIYLTDSFEEISKKLSTAVTDTRRQKKTDAGVPEECNIFSMHKLVSDPEQIKYCREGCMNATIGCFECKRILAENLNRELEPFRENKKRWSSELPRVKEIIFEGSKTARKIASKTIEEVKEKTGLWSF
ncbi:tryptophan--tRNA ligase [candidate division WOR-3 bacterium]|nr:tryptophan--tRNA ligase [candidate division WOR-3 bacterium]